jgi:hypothetical protein
MTTSLIRRRSRALALVPTALFLGLAAFISADIAHAIVGGDPDGKRHPFVGIVAYQLTMGGPWYVPNGGNAVLVSPTVAVTAGHVLEIPLTRERLGVDPYARGVVFDPVPVDRNAPMDLAVFREVPASAVHVAKFVAWHPDLFASPDTPTDIGVLVFEQPVTGRPTARIAKPGLFDTLSSVYEPRMEIVGYGGTEFACCPPAGGGNRYSGTTALVDLTADVIITAALEEDQASAGPGDSGAAVLIDHNMLVGVLSSFDPPPDPDMLPFGRYNRTDSESACEFLSNYLPLRCSRIGY